MKMKELENVKTLTGCILYAKDKKISIKFEKGSYGNLSVYIIKDETAGYDDSCFDSFEVANESLMDDWLTEEEMLVKILKNAIFKIEKEYRNFSKKKMKESAKINA